MKMPLVYNLEFCHVAIKAFQHKVNTYMHCTDLTLHMISDMFDVIGNDWGVLLIEF